jgi:hypothetical protein
MKCLRRAFCQRDQLVDGGEGCQGHSQMEVELGRGLCQ